MTSVDDAGDKSEPCADGLTPLSFRFRFAGIRLSKRGHRSGVEDRFAQSRPLERANPPLAQCLRLRRCAMQASKSANVSRPTRGHTTGLAALGRLGAAPAKFPGSAWATSTPESLGPSSPSAPAAARQSDNDQVQLDVRQPRDRPFRSATTWASSPWA